MKDSVKQNNSKSGAIPAAIVLLAFVAGLALGGSRTELVGGFMTQPTTSIVRSASSWDEELYPNYVRKLGSAIIDRAVPVVGSIQYSSLDRLGRAGRAQGTITYTMMEEGLARERSDLSLVFPSGWNGNSRVEITLPNGGSYRGYFWNRSHLIAKSLGGADTAENLITGTRMQNVGANDGNGGMAYLEGLVRAYLEAHPDKSVYYCATPIFVDDELVARSVIVDIRSSDGLLDGQYEVFNCALGFSIDYLTGSFEAAP